MWVFVQVMTTAAGMVQISQVTNVLHAVICINYGFEVFVTVMEWVIACTDHVIILSWLFYVVMVVLKFVT